MSNRREKYALGVRLMWEIFPEEYVTKFFCGWKVEINGQSKRLSEFQNMYQKYITLSAGNKVLNIHDSDNLVPQDGSTQVDIFQLYFDWLSMMVFEWLDKNNIQYY